MQTKILDLTQNIDTVGQRFFSSEIEALTDTVITEPQVTALGDFNGDGFDDWQITFQGFTPGDYTRINYTYFVFGQSSGDRASLDLSNMTESQGFLVEGISNATISRLGDINGDGFDDIALTIGGQYNIVLGNASPESQLSLDQLNGNNGFEVIPTDLDMELLPLGDFNGDGFNDILVSVSNYSSFNSTVGHIIFGSDRGFAPTIDLNNLSPDQGITFDTEVIYQYHNSSSYQIGDINGDGFDDIIVDLYEVSYRYGYYSDYTYSAQYLIFGASETPAIVDPKLRPKLLFPNELTNIGDINSDGIDDFKTNYDQVILSPTDLTALPETINFNGRNGFTLTADGLLGEIHAAGDINQDGFNDLLIDVFYETPQEPGLEYQDGFVLFGRSQYESVINLNDLSPDHGFALNLGEDFLQGSLTPLSDTNNDNIPDFFMTSSAGDGYLITGQQEPYPLSTRQPIDLSNGKISLASLNGENGFTLNGGSSSLNAGIAVSGIGDINQDGIDDILIGAIDENYEQEPEGSLSFIVFGQRSGFDPSFDLSSLDGRNGFTLERRSYGVTSVSAAGDVNGDGIDDFIIGATGPSVNNREPLGHSYIIFGRTDGFDAAYELQNLDPTLGFRIQGSERGSRFGSSVSGAGDINGDGFDDLIIGAHNTYPGGVSRVGTSYVVFGKADRFPRIFTVSQLDGSNGFILNGVDQDDRAGYSVSGAGDLNDDGIDDLIIGAWGADTEDRREVGEAYVVYGSRAGFEQNFNLDDLNGSNGYVIRGFEAFGSIGLAVSDAGDINGDGVDDVIIGGTGRNPEGGFDTGLYYVVFGEANMSESRLDLQDLNGQNGFVIYGKVETGSGPISAVGDVNGDGIDDILLGAPSADVDSNNSAGESYVIFGRKDEFASSLQLSRLDGQNGYALQGIRTGDGAGGSVSGAGDVNGDGIHDLIIGARSADPNGISGAGQSYVVFGNGAEADGGDRIVGTAESEILRGTAEDNLILGKTGNDTLNGFGGNDRLVGGGGNDFMVGGGGHDRLTGGNGFDTLKGGAGEDEFVFTNVRHKADRILDFNVTEDVILIRKSGFDLDLGKGRLANARFTIGSGASDRSDRFIYNNQTGALIFDVDGSGAGEGRAIAFLSNSPDLTAANIRII